MLLYSVLFHRIFIIFKQVSEAISLHRYIRGESKLSRIHRNKISAGKKSFRRRPGVCTEIHGAELWRFMELPVVCGAGKHEPARLVIRVRSIP